MLKVSFLNVPIPASFCLFSSFSHHNFNNTNQEKCRWCVACSLFPITIRKLLIIWATRSFQHDQHAPDDSFFTLIYFSNYFNSQSHSIFPHWKWSALISNRNNVTHPQCWISFAPMTVHTVLKVRFQYWAVVVVAESVERLLPIPEVCSSNPVIGKNIYWAFTVNCIEKMKIKKKKPRMAHFKKTPVLYLPT